MLDELERLAREATPGIWQVDEEGVYTRVEGRYRVILSANITDDRRTRDAQFIAFCSPDRMLKVAKALRAAEALRIALEADGCLLDNLDLQDADATLRDALKELG